ncbi:MAG: hypothetical protein Q8Q00_04755 [Dehalococcoidia bacterium]|nr:hypothetical protein [Dehalococcoidia bacterium]
MDDQSLVHLPGTPSLALPDDLTPDQWVEEGRKLRDEGLQLQRQTDNWRFRVGDWLAFGERKFGEDAVDRTVEEVVAGLQVGSETLRQLVWVSQSIRPALRRLDVSWSVHRAVASLPPADQEKWLEKAAGENLTTRDIIRMRFPAAPGSEREHTKIQYMLLELGKNMGYEVWAPQSDRSGKFIGRRLGEIGLLDRLPRAFKNQQAQKIVERIDTLWVDRDSIVAAFEVEHTTTVYSGLLRMCDLLAVEPYLRVNLFVVAPEERRKFVINQINRPTFHGLKMPDKCRLISFERLTEEIERLGDRTLHMKDTFLSYISQDCRLPEGTTSMPEEE